MKIFKKSYWVSLVVIFVIATSFLAGYLAHEIMDTKTGKYKLLSQAYDLLLNFGYATPPAAPALEYGMIRGMLQAYGDPFSSFAEPASTELQANNLQGSFGGIGADLLRDAEGNYLLNPYFDGPAYQAGIREGDRLILVDEQPVTPQSAQETVAAALSGEVGSQVKVVIARPPGFLSLEFSLSRVEIAIPSVTWHLDLTQPALGIIKVNLIAATSAEEIQRAVADMADRGAAHYVLDLRDNYGGLLEAGVDVARLFLEDGIVIRELHRDQETEIYEVNRPGPLADIPLAVLINHNTASAAEIVAGALQARQRAVIIGDPSYGKNTIQLVFQLEDGSSLHITNALWTIPGLPPFTAEQGLIPDLPASAEDPAILDRYVQAAIVFFNQP